MKTENSNERNDSNISSDDDDMNVFVSDLLHQMTSKFEYMGNQIMSRMEDIGSRINSLEKSVGDLLDQQANGTNTQEKMKSSEHDQGKGNF